MLLLSSVPPLSVAYLQIVKVPKNILTDHFPTMKQCKSQGRSSAAYTVTSSVQDQPHEVKALFNMLMQLALLRMFPALFECSGWGLDTGSMAKSSAKWWEYSPIYLQHNGTCVYRINTFQRLWVHIWNKYSTLRIIRPAEHSTFRIIVLTNKGSWSEALPYWNAISHG